MTLEEAFKEWQKHAPLKFLIEDQTIQYTDRYGSSKRFKEKKHFNGDCCNFSHFIKGERADVVAKSDSQVCERERAWRNYVRIRDGVN